jgi:polysaccharide biosynthesis protein PslG
VNLANGVPISIWYDWHDDGTEPSEPEHHFGTVRFPYHADRQPVYDAKPAYLAVQTLTGGLAGYCFKERVRAGSPENDYVLAFAKGDRTCLAAWTTSPEPHAVLIPGLSGRYQAVGHAGQSLPTPDAGAGGLTVALTDAPQYLLPLP